ncbi:MAG: hypothetical protein ACLRNQ_25480 [Flavonifractor plautii]
MWYRRFTCCACTAGALACCGRRGVGLTVAALAVAALLRALEPLTAVTLCYFAELACNTVSALRLGRRGRCFGLGLPLFVGCDLCVGLHNLAAFLPVVDTGPLFSFAQVGMWLFTCPLRC